jgi:L-alanine-DL-glutamate epimerase-like enolase superfamily enzyme
MPRRPNGEEPRDCQPIQRDDRSRSKSRSRREHQSQRDIEVQNKWGHGEKLDKKSAKIKKLLRSAQKELQQIGVYWLEEPIMSRSLSQYVNDHFWLADRVDIPLAGGESLLTRYEYIDLLAKIPFDFIQPDAASVGGISELKRIGDMASAWNLKLVPHIGCSSGTGIGLAAGLNVILSCENAPLVEFDAYGGLGWEGFLTNPLNVKDGRLFSNNQPGIGVTLAPTGREQFSLLPGV